MDAATLGLVFAAFLLAGAVKGVVGLGLPTVAIAILGSTLGLREAVPLLVVPAVATNLWQVLQGPDAGGTMRRFWVMNAASCLGIVAGTEILFQVDPRLLSALLGVVLAVYAGLGLLRLRPRVPVAWERPLAPPVGLLSGLLAGMTGSLGMPAIVYLQGLGLTKDAFVQGIGMTFLIGGTAWGGALVWKGALDAASGFVSALAVLPAVLGMMAGQRLRERVSEESFRVALFVALLVIGLHLLARRMAELL